MLPWTILKSGPARYVNKHNYSNMFAVRATQSIYTTSLIFSAPAIVLIVWLHKKRARRPQHSKFALTCTDILDCRSQLRHVLTYSQHMLHKQRATSRTQMRAFPASVHIAASLACNKRALGTAARARAMAIFYRLLGPKQPE